MNFDMSQFLTAEKIFSLLRFAFLLLLGLPVIYYISRLIRSYTGKIFSPQQGMIFSKIFFYFSLFILAFSVLNELGFKLHSLLGAAGIIGIAVGFASQTSVSNIISGLFLIAEQPFKVNDIINVQNITGVVLSIDTLSVKLRTFDNKFIRIPNETIVKSEVTNITHFPIRRVDMNIGIAYKEDIGRVRNILLDIARQNPLCLNEPEPMVIFSGFGNSSIDLLFVAWAVKEDWLKVKNSLGEEVKKRFDEEKIEIPFPHVSLYKGAATEPIPVTVVGKNH